MDAWTFHELYEKYDESEEDADGPDMNLSWYAAAYNLDGPSPSWKDCQDPIPIRDSLRVLVKRLVPLVPKPSPRLLVEVRDPKTKELLHTLETAIVQCGAERVNIQTVPPIMRVVDANWKELRREPLSSGNTFRGEAYGRPGTRLLYNVIDAEAWGEPVDALNRVVSTCQVAIKHKGRVLVGSTPS